jgi:hypothetical protein
MNHIYRVPARETAIAPGEDWNHFLSSLEAWAAGDRQSAIRYGANYALHAAIFEGTDEKGLMTTASQFMEETYPPLTYEEKEIFMGQVEQVLVTHRSVQAMVTRREKIVARREDFSS